MGLFLLQFNIRRELQTAEHAPKRHGAGQYAPSFYMKGRVELKEELRLIRIGYPLSEAVGIVYQKRKDGDLEQFVLEKEREYAEDCKRYAEEVLG